MSRFICNGCQDITIKGLIELAYQAYSPDLVPKEAHYVLHDSLDSLRQAGCAFYSLLITTPHGHDENDNWIASLWRCADCKP